MICRMCLMDSLGVLDIFAGGRTAYNIAATIAQHFWFEPKYDDEMSNMICDACWRKIESFHEYYLCVEEAQRKWIEELALHQEQQEQESRAHPLADGIQFLKQEPLESYGENDVNLGGDGNAIQVIEYTVEQKLEQDDTLDNKADVYSYIIEEVGLASTKTGGLREEDITASLYDAIPQHTVTIRHPEVQTNIGELVNRELVDYHSNGHNGNADYAPENARLASLRVRPTEICSTNLTSTRKRKFSLKCKEDNLKIARHMELKCDLCGMDFSTFAEISRHMIEAHGRTGYVKCCNRKFFKKCTILDHLNEHFDSDYFKCSKCNKSFSDRRCLKKHLLRHEKAEISSSGLTKNPQKRSLLKCKEDDLKIARHIELKCDLCGGDFATFAEIDRHMIEAHGRTGYIKCCNRKFFKKCTVLDHLNEHFDSDYFKCSKCNKSFSDSRCLKKHLSRHDKIEIGSTGQTKNRQKKFSLKCKEDDLKIARQLELKCDICGGHFDTFAEIDRHMIKAHGRRGYIICCNRKFFKKCTVLGHLENHFETDYFKCSKSNKSYADKRSLKKHLPRNGVEEKVSKVSKKCPVSEKVIKGETLIAEHKLELSDLVDKKIQCGKCAVWLKNSYSLRIHTKKVHRDGKAIKGRRFGCKICGSMLISNEGLKAHVKYVHASQREFVCSVCGKGFKRVLTLKEHMARHTGEPLYTCLHCPRTFKNSGNLCTHRKKAHRQEWEESRRMRGLRRANRRNKANQNTIKKEAKINSNLS